MTTIVVIEDEPDLRFLIETIFSLDPRFSLAGQAASAEEGFALARSCEPALIVLDHGLAGELTGIDAAPRFKELVPHVKIILFSADAELKIRASEEPAIDAFLLKTQITQLLSLAQHLTGLDLSFD